MFRIPDADAHPAEPRAQRASCYPDYLGQWTLLMHRMCQKAESPDHNPHLAALKSHFEIVCSHLSRHLLNHPRHLLPHRRHGLFRLGFSKKFRPPDQAPERCFAVDDL